MNCFGGSNQGFQHGGRQPHRDPLDQVRAEQGLRQSGPSVDAALALEFMGFGGPDATEGLANLHERRPPRYGSASADQGLAFMRDIISSILALRSALMVCMCGRSPIIFR